MAQVGEPATFHPTRDQLDIEIEVFGGTSGGLNSEKFLISFASSWIKSGDFVIDAGANHGQHARLFANMVGIDGVVHWVEADPDICDSLQKGAAASSMSVVVKNFPLGNFTDDETVTFYRHKLRDQEGSLFKREGRENYESISVVGQKLDSISVKNPNFIKIDVEGAEFEILKGAKKLFGKSSPLVGIELTRFPDSSSTYTPMQFLEILEDMQYDIFNISGKLVTLEKWLDPSFFMNHQNWLAKRETLSHIFALEKIPKFSKAFNWGATDNVPYPFKLIDFPG